MKNREKHKIARDQVIKFNLDTIPADQELIAKIPYPFPDDEKNSYDHCYFFKSSTMLSIITFSKKKNIHYVLISVPLKSCAWVNEVRKLINIDPSKGGLPLEARGGKEDLICGEQLFFYSTGITYGLNNWSRPLTVFDFDEPNSFQSIRLNYEFFDSEQFQEMWQKIVKEYPLKKEDIVELEYKMIFRE